MSRRPPLRSRPAPDAPGADATSASDLGFSHHVRGGGAVAILRHGRLVATLRGPEAARFLARLDGAAPALAQRLMARLTGNYRRGNERAAGPHPRNRG